MLPKHIVERFGSQRNFKESKRANIRAIAHWLEALSLGCAWMPDSALRNVDEIRRNLEILKEATSIKKWGR